MFRSECLTHSLADACWAVLFFNFYHVGTPTNVVTSRTVQTFTSDVFGLIGFCDYGPLYLSGWLVMRNRPVNRRVSRSLLPRTKHAQATSSFLPVSHQVRPLKNTFRVLVLSQEKSFRPSNVSPIDAIDKVGRGDNRDTVLTLLGVWDPEHNWTFLDYQWTFLTISFPIRALGCSRFRKSSFAFAVRPFIPFPQILSSLMLTSHCNHNLPVDLAYDLFFANANTLKTIPAAHLVRIAFEVSRHAREACGPRLLTSTSYPKPSTRLSKSGVRNMKNSIEEVPDFSSHVAAYVNSPALATRLWSWSCSFGRVFQIFKESKIRGPNEVTLAVYAEIETILHPTMPFHPFKQTFKIVEDGIQTQEMQMFSDVSSVLSPPGHSEARLYVSCRFLYPYLTNFLVYFLEVYTLCSHYISHQDGMTTRWSVFDGGGLSGGG
ncbi:hypothetical protein BKA70DRAFT_1527136 [Coprinopsis sp. MPI-PUGE-AT-0042]|nr:hypothetical protein BKA70DRAFT_1527136 [Coprinopsis sp. MPI-PUGE-AT-0042]